MYVCLHTFNGKSFSHENQHPENRKRQHLCLSVEQGKRSIYDCKFAAFLAYILHADFFLCSSNMTCIKILLCEIGICFGALAMYSYICILYIWLDFLGFPHQLKQGCRNKLLCCVNFVHWIKAMQYKPIGSSTIQHTVT